MDNDVRGQLTAPDSASHNALSSASPLLSNHGLPHNSRLLSLLFRRLLRRCTTGAELCAILAAIGSDVLERTFR
jgi:hypothetical protein